MRPLELKPERQLLLHLAARVYHTTLLSLGQGAGTPYACLRKRGLADEMIGRKGLGYATGDLLCQALAMSGLPRTAAAELNLLDQVTHSCESMAGRIVFPDCDQSGRVLNLIGQRFAPWLDAHAPQYVNLTGTPTLYGYARLDKRRSQRPVLLVETPLDVLLARQWGFDALSPLGTQMAKEQARLLNWLPRPLLIIGHNDDGDAGRKQVERWQMELDKGIVALMPAEVKGLSELAAKPDGEMRFVSWLKSLGHERNPKTTRLHRT